MKPIFPLSPNAGMASTRTPWSPWYYRSMSWPSKTAHAWQLGEITASQEDWSHVLSARCLIDFIYVEINSGFDIKGDHILLTMSPFIQAVKRRRKKAQHLSGWILFIALVKARSVPVQLKSLKLDYVQQSGRKTLLQYISVFQKKQSCVGRLQYSSVGKRDAFITKNTAAAVRDGCHEEIPDFKRKLWVFRQKANWVCTGRPSEP